MSEADGFLSRWSKRKMGREAPAEPADAAASTAPVAMGTPTEAPNAQPAQPAAAALQAEAPALPNLTDVAKLTRESDYAPYVNLQVDPHVRNAAMKKLFSDPHFNVMDGLDTYIDDYGKPDPLPLAMLRQMTSARALGLFADEEAAQAKAVAAAAAPAPKPEPAAPVPGVAEASPDSVAPPVLAQSRSEPIESIHEDTDLRLQPDDAAGRPGPDEGPGRAG